MGDASEFPLRPLGIGEIFDRAVTIYVRHFVPFTLIVLTFLAPLGVVRYFVLGEQAGLAQVFSDPSGKNIPPAQLGSMMGGLFLVLLLAVLLAPIVNNAIAVGVANIYSGKQPSYAQGFRAAFSHWASLFGATILMVLVCGGVYVGSVIVIFIIIAIGAAFMQSMLPLAIILYILAGIAFLAMLLLFLVMLVASAFALYSTSIENLGAVNAVSKAFGRIFNRKEIGKAFLMALSFFGLEMGVALVSVGIALMLEFWAKNYALMIGVETIINALLSAFVAILLAVYYYDVRTRAEGLDLEVDLSRLTA